MAEKEQKTLTEKERQFLMKQAPGLIASGREAPSWKPIVPPCSGCKNKIPKMLICKIYPEDIPKEILTKKQLCTDRIPKKTEK